MKHFGFKKPDYRADTGVRLCSDTPRRRWYDALRDLLPVLLPVLLVAGLLTAAVLQSHAARQRFDAACIARGGAPTMTYPAGSVCLDKKAIR